MLGKKKKSASVKRKPKKRSVPLGRTLSTQDNYLGRSKTGSTKERPVVVIETNKRNDLAVVPLSSRNGKHRTRLKKYQDGRSYFKHFVEIEDDEGKPIRVGRKFRENHKNQDVSAEDVELIRYKVLYHSSPAPKNLQKMKKFQKQKKSPRLNHSGHCQCYAGRCSDGCCRMPIFSITDFICLSTPF